MKIIDADDKEKSVSVADTNGGRTLKKSTALSKPPFFVRPRALKILATQPISLIGLSQAKRDNVVVAAVADQYGNEYVESRIGDSVWRLASESKVKNRKGSDQNITWQNNIPTALVNDAKSVLYCAMRRGPNGKPWSAGSVYRTGKDVRQLFLYFKKIGIQNFSEVRALHLSDYISELKKTLTGSSIRNILQIVDLVWRFPLEVLHPLPENPWGNESFSQACNYNDQEVGAPTGKTGKTPVIPREAQRLLFKYCEECLEDADSIFEDRDAGRISANSYELTEIRDAVLYLSQITSGMRNSESTGITNGCWRTEVKNGVKFHWVRTREVKTGKGIVDFLVPQEAIAALEKLKRYAEPLQTRLADEARWLEGLVRIGPDDRGILRNGMKISDVVGRLNHVREIANHMFLTVSNSQSDHLDIGSRIEVMSLHNCNAQLKTLTRSAGSDWNLSNRQCRRTFAYNVVNSRLGHMGLVFLKWQLKHSSLSWTQLYASNPYQDLGLYRELLDEQTAARIQLMEGWMQSDAPLSGGAGKKIIQNRVTPVRDLKDLLRHAAEVIEIRHTGHAWCLSGTRPCHGQGIYEPAFCGGCSRGVIDSGDAATWQMIHLENLRLAAVTDCGPAVIEKARRAIRRSEEVLADLQVALPSIEEQDAYEKAGAIR